MRFGHLDINPAHNPAVLDTATWDRAAAWIALGDAAPGAWDQITGIASSRSAEPQGPAVTFSGLTAYPASWARHHGKFYSLIGLPDGQQLFVAIAPPGADPLAERVDADADSPLGPVLGTREVGQGQQLAAYPADAEVVERYFRKVNNSAGPRALGPVPRLGIGTRMTTAVWPAIWESMLRCGFASNGIQNSVRELNVLEDLLAGRPPERNIAFGFGEIETGYTGSSWQWLWLAGALDGLQRGAPPYGADADHIQVKRGIEGMARARRLVDAARRFTFFTLDVSDVLDYAALTAAPAEAEALLELRVGDAAQRRDLLTFHGQARRLGGHDYQPDPTSLARLVGKYWRSLEAVAELRDYIDELREGAAFDLELSIDEHPNDIAGYDCLTSADELCFVLLEAQRRGIPLTHVAPNFGVEKGTDYRCPDGLAGLQARSQLLAAIAEGFGVMVDYHSGDDLSATTRRAIGRATDGRLHFKVSPMLQLIFGEVLADYHPSLFRRWWEDALAYARRAADQGSSFAADCLRQDEAEEGLRPSTHGSVFHHFSFPFVGQRNAEGQFANREVFYSLAPAFYQAYRDRLVSYLCELAHDLF